MDPVQMYAAAIVTVGTALGLLALGVRVLGRGVRRVVHLADEVLGDGSAERPGWGAQIAQIQRDNARLREDTGETRALVAGVDRRLARVEDALTRVPISLRGDNGQAVQHSMEVRHVD